MLWKAVFYSGCSGMLMPWEQTHWRYVQIKGKHESKIACDFVKALVEGSFVVCNSHLNHTSMMQCH